MRAVLGLKRKHKVVVYLCLEWFSVSCFTR